MNKTSRLKKSLITFIVILIAVCAKSSTAYGVYFSGWKSGYSPLWSSKTYYCIEHQDGFNGGTYTSYKTETIRSDNSSQAKRALAYILYQGKKTGNGGYNGRGMYQTAVWKWYYNNSRINTSYPYGLSDNGLYNTAMKQSAVAYSTETAKIQAKDINIGGTKGNAKLNSLTGSVSKIEVTWKNPKDGKTYTQTIKSGKSTVKGWIALYSNSGRTEALKVKDISTKKFYFTNLKSDYLIKNMKIYTETKASGYKVTITYYTKANGDSSKQNLISAKYEEGKKQELSVTLKPEYEYGNIEIIKRGDYQKDGKTQTVKLPNTTFKIYCPTVDKWVVGTKDGKKSFGEFKDAGEYKTDNNGKVTISKLLSSGYKYEIVEVKIDNKDYNPIKMTKVTSNKQNGLTVSNLKVGSTSYYSTKNVVVTANSTNTVTIYDEKDEPDEPTPTPTPDTLTVSGKVWVDTQDTKAASYNHIYDNSDTLLKGIEVRLCQNNDNNVIAKTTTGSNGYYYFTKKTNGKELQKEDLTNSYVMFIYDNQKYITVNPNVGSNEAINSKAIEADATTTTLNDTKLTGTTGANPGKAVTKTILADKLNNNKVENINLGLIEKHDPNYSIAEELDCVKVEMNGYTYTYKYSAKDAVDSNTKDTINSLFVPTTSSEDLSGYYTSQVYPSDVAYNIKNQGEKLKVYAVYRITVRNTDNTDIDELYKEQKLYLTSLTNSFDSERYELAEDENSLWGKPETKTNSKGEKYSEVSYAITDENSVYKDGIEKGKEKSTSIQFKVKEEALNKMLKGDFTGENSVPTQTKANAYHEYLRADNVWAQNPTAKSYNGEKRTDKYFLHRSVDKEAKSYSLYIHMKLGEARTISGKVFEDTATNTGIYDNNENITKGVTVELLNADKDTVTDLYQIKDKAIVMDENNNLPKAKIITGDDGTYSFEGVVPGLYYIRFTYSDGNQLYTPAGSPGVIIKADDYESTEINSNIQALIENANNLSDLAEIENKQNIILGNVQGDKEAAKKLLEWYKYTGENSYSVAMDDLVAGKEVKDGKTSKKAYTPVTSISIENDIADSTSDVSKSHKNLYSRFNLGIIARVHVKIGLEKKITNVSVVAQEGAEVLSQNPQTSTDSRLVSLDSETAGGSTDAKLETETNILYGGKLAVTYKITIKNESSRKINIDEVFDDIDKKYDFDTDAILALTSNNETREITISKGTNDNGERRLIMTGWGDLEPDQSIEVTYTAKADINDSEESLLYVNNAVVGKIIVDNNGEQKTLKQDSIDGNTIQHTNFVMIPPTGGNRDTLYLVVGTLALVVIATGIVVIKKKVI